MKKLAIPLSILAAGALGACTEPAYRPADVVPMTAIAPQPLPYHLGTGTIAKITASPSYVTAAAGGSAPSATVRPGYPLNRLIVRMDNGATQFIDTDSNEFRSGMRVELLPDRTIRPLNPVAVIQPPAVPVAPAPVQTPR